MVQALTQAQLLDTWDRASAGTAMQHAVTLLQAACPDENEQHIACLSLAERDARLLALRELTFGTDLLCVTACPACEEGVEIHLTTDEVRANLTPVPDGGWELSQNGLRVRFRPPNTLDLAEIEHMTDLAAARSALLTRCIIEVTPLEVPKNAQTLNAALPDAVHQAVVDHITDYQAQADIRIGLVCPTCSGQWEANFDIAAYFWAELDVWARTLMNDIHRLALAYGWSEADTLSLSPRRRKAYLGMITP